MHRVLAQAWRMQSFKILIFQISQILAVYHTGIPSTPREVRKGSFEMFFDGQTAECRFISLDYPCDFWKVNVRTIYSTGTLMIIEYSTFDEAACRCKVDASFTIENIPQNEFVLKIYHGDTNGNYNKTTPKYEGRINPAEGKIMIPY